MLEMVGYISFLFMGFILGTIGAGGSIISIPILIYLFQKPFFAATTYSLLIVGITSLIGILINNRNVNYRKITIFAIPSIITIFLMRYYIIKLIPSTLFALDINKILTILLGILITFVGYLILVNKIQKKQSTKLSNSYIKIILISIITAMIMGLLGVGGGFIIVPSLIQFLQFENKEAITSSLIIISTSSMVGFAGDIAKSHIELDLIFVSLSILISISGIILGRYLHSLLSTEGTKKLFASFMLVFGPLLALNEILLLRI